MPPTIDILIPAVNNAHFTCSLIRSIKAHTSIPCIEIIRAELSWFNNELENVDLQKKSHTEIDDLLSQKFQNKVIEVDRNLAFFSVVMHRSVLEKVGYLDERYGLGLYDDDDYCVRIVENNLKLFLALDVYIWHLASTIFKKIYSNNGLIKC